MAGGIEHALLILDAGLKLEMWQINVEFLPWQYLGTLAETNYGSFTDNMRISLGTSLGPQPCLDPESTTKNLLSHLISKMKVSDGLLSTMTGASYAACINDAQSDIRNLG